MGKSNETVKDVIDYLSDDGIPKALAYVKNGNLCIIGAFSLRPGPHELHIVDNLLGANYGEIEEKFGHLSRSYKSFDDLKNAISQEEDIKLIGDDFIGYFPAIKTRAGWEWAGHVVHPEYNPKPGEPSIRFVDTRYERNTIDDMLGELNNSE